LGLGLAVAGRRAQGPEVEDAAVFAKDPIRSIVAVDDRPIATQGAGFQCKDRVLVEDPSFNEHSFIVAAKKSVQLPRKWPSFELFFARNGHKTRAPSI